MIKITKGEMRDKLISLMELGLTNADIAERLNEEYGADERNKINSIGVSKLKAQLDIKNMKPKKKSLFELVDDVEEVEQVNEPEANVPEEAPITEREANDFFVPQDIG